MRLCGFGAGDQPKRARQSPGEIKSGWPEVPAFNSGGVVLDTDRKRDLVSRGVQTCSVANGVAAEGDSGGGSKIVDSDVAGSGGKSSVPAIGGLRGSKKKLGSGLEAGKGATLVGSPRRTSSNGAISLSTEKVLGA